MFSIIQHGMHLSLLSLSDIPPCLLPLSAWLLVRQGRAKYVHVQTFMLYCLEGHSNVTSCLIHLVNTVYQVEYSGTHIV